MESRLIFLHQNHCDGVTEKAKTAAAVPSKHVGGSSWQIRKVIQRQGVSASRPAREDEVFDAPLPGKASKLQVNTSVPKTDTGG